MKIKKIESSTNPLYKKLLSLTKSRGVREEELCLVSGEKVIEELLKDEVPSSAFWVFWQEDHPLFALNTELQRVILPKDLFEELDLVGNHKPLVCWPTPKVNEWKGENLPMAHEVLCALGDPNNLGALLRSARAFGVQNVVLLEECCHPFHAKAIKASSGAAFGLHYFKGPSIKNLRDVRQIVALDMQGKTIREFDFAKAPAWRLLLGEEGQGIPESLKCEKVKIPCSGEVESLNATVAASILFYELSQYSIITL